MQRHRILLNLSFTSSTQSINSNLQNINQYEVNNVQGLGGGIVNPSNVRFFLNNDVNDLIINDFFSYLTGSTTNVEFTEIYNSDQKLSDTFNNYYVSSVLNNQLPPMAVIDLSLSGTSGVTIIENTINNYNGNAPSKYLEGIPLSIDNSTKQLRSYSALTTYTLEESYYVPVFIKRNLSQIGREKVLFDQIERVISADANNYSYSYYNTYYGRSGIGIQNI